MEPMEKGALAFAVYPFEGLVPDLASAPIAARRALDHAGLRLSTEGWRSLPHDVRVALTTAGARPRVDVEAVDELVSAASFASPTSIERVPSREDPSRIDPPELVRDVTGWSELRGLDRYALWYVRTRAAARRSFAELAAEEIDIHELASAASLAFGDEPVEEGEGFRATTPEPESVELTGVEAQSVRPSSPLLEDELASAEVDDAVYSVAEHAPTIPGFDVRQLVSTHLTEAGDVHMVDVGAKAVVARRAIARGTVRMRGETLARLASKDTPKGEVLGTARVAGIMAAKRTPEIVPLCHHVALTHVEVDLELVEEGDAGAVIVTATVDVLDRTGCEMEALVAVSAACLTVYDMLKGIDREMAITDVVLLEKRGGRSGHYRRGASDEGAR